MLNIFLLNIWLNVFKFLTFCFNFDWKYFFRYLALKLLYIRFVVFTVYERNQAEKNTKSNPPIHKQFCDFLIPILLFVACLLHFSFRYIWTRTHTFCYSVRIFDMPTRAAQALIRQQKRKKKVADVNKKNPQSMEELQGQQKEIHRMWAKKEDNRIWQQLKAKIENR